jgi:hypothetical protein
MTLEILEQELDRALEASQAKAVEAAIAADDVVAARVERLKAQRALRAAALSTYSPAIDESRMLAMSAIEACYEQSAAPIARIGWMKKVGAVAAALVIAAVSFYAGRSTSHTPAPSIVNNPTVQDSEKVVVVVKDGSGNVLEEKIFNQMQEAQAYVDSMSRELPGDSPAIEEGTPIGVVF